MQLSTLRYQGYTARITNLSTMEELQDWVSECNITLPQSNLISSMEARFQLEEKKINKGNEIKIEILDDVGNVLYSLQGEANIPRRTKSCTGLEVWEYNIKDSYNRLFEKVVSESQTFYDLYLCNINDKHNSLLHKIASALGFREEELDFESVAFENGNLIRLPFVYLEENSRWIDKLQAFIEATDGILYIKNKKLFFRPRNLSINHSFSFNRTNIITSLEESEKEVLQNGIRLVYDRYEKLDNQVVFNLQKKIITEPNTKQDTEVPIMRISFITSAVSNPTLTKASGYYFATEDPNSKVDITLEENVHYKKMSWKETGAEVKFYNPLPYKLYVDNFEIKGVPLSMYADNEVSVMYPNVLEKHQENFITSSKNKFIQTSEQAKFLAKKAMQRGIVNNAEYHFNTPFLHQIEVGGVYGLDLEDIHTVIEITNISINLRPGVFRMDIQGISVKEEIGSVKINSKLSGNPKERYIDLSSVKKDIQETKEELSHKYEEEILSLSKKYDKELSKVTEKLGELTQGIQDNKVKIHTIKPYPNTLTDSNIGDMYISDTSVEILVKEGNKYIWKPLKDSETKKALEQYIQETNSKLVTISYQEKAPTSPNAGDIWIDTKNDGIWKRWNGSKWEQVDTSVRNALKRANKDIQKIETTLEEVNNTVKYKIFAKAFVQEETPYHGIKEHDVWYNPKTNVYKVWFNNRWNNASEEDIFPALRHYVSLQNATLEIGKKADQANQRAGIFLTNNDQRFGSKYGDLAEVSIDKKGSIRLKNANNLLEWNVKDPQNSYKMKSRFYMGVTDVDRIPDDVYFKVGDESNGFSIELKEGSCKASVDGKDLSKKISDVDKNITNLAQADRENKRDLESRIQSAERNANQKAQESKEAAQRYADALVEAEQIRADKNATTEAKKQAEEKLNLAKNYAEEKAREAKSAAQRYVDSKLQQYASTITKDIQSLQSQVDGAVETWFYDPTPTLQNEPARNWTSNSDKDKHVGDLYYSTDGKAYRFMKNSSYGNTSYEWKLIEDSDVTKALSEAKKAKDTADGKRRVFVLQPKPPYDIGDMWVDNGEVWVCQQEMSSGYFSNHHWRKLKYTDDTKANSVAEQQKSDKKELDKNINNLAQADRENKRDLEQGNFVVTGNTIFDGTASITSKGTNERIQLSGGSLDFYRMVDGKEIRLSQIRNQKSGTIATDWKGSGILELKGWRVPIVMTQSIRSVNVGHGLASIWCYHEMIKSDPPTYKFFLGSTTEKVQFNNPVSTEQLSETIHNVTSINVQSSRVKIPTSDIYFSVEEDKLQEGIKNMNAKIFCVSRVTGRYLQGLTYSSNKASEMCSYEELQKFYRARFSKEDWIMEDIFEEYHYKVNRQIETETLTFTEQEFLQAMKQVKRYPGVTFQYYLRIREGENIINLHRGGFSIKKLKTSEVGGFGYFIPEIVSPNPDIILPSPFTKTFESKKIVTVEHICDSQYNAYLSDLNNLVYTVKRVGGPKGTYTLEEVTFDNNRPQWIFYGFDGRQLLFNRNITYTYTSKEIQKLEGYGEINYTAFEID